MISTCWKDFVETFHPMGLGTLSGVDPLFVPESEAKILAEDLLGGSVENHIWYLCKRPGTDVHAVCARKVGEFVGYCLITKTPYDRKIHESLYLYA